jgi:hypothetical protein
MAIFVLHHDVHDDQLRAGVKDGGMSVWLWRLLRLCRNLCMYHGSERQSSRHQPEESSHDLPPKLCSPALPTERSM